MSYDPRWELLDRIWSSDTEVRVYDVASGDPTSQATVIVDGAAVATFDANGILLANGVAVNEFSVDPTLSGDSTTVVATEYAVKAYVDTQIGTLTQDRIVDGDSVVQVSDGGPGSRVDFTLDNELQMSLTASGLAFDVSDGTVASNVRVIAFDNDATMGGYNAEASGDNGANDYLPTQWAVRKYIDDIHSDMSEPTGFVNQSDSEYGIDSSSTFYIQPVSSEYTLFMGGQRWVKTIRDEVEISDVEGTHYIYFDTDGVLKETTTFDINFLYTQGYVAELYWDATAKEVIYLGEERHGITMDGKTHANIHRARGTLYVSGLALGNLTADSTGGADADAEFSVANGLILDEDISLTIPAQAFPANLPMWYLNGAGADWRKEAADDFPLINRGTGRMAWNKDTAGTWSQEEATDGYYVLTHVFATNDPDMPVIGVVGQAEYSSLADSRLGAASEINTIVGGSLPFAEFVPIATVIYQTDDTFTNTPKAIVVSNDEGDSWTDWRTAGLSPAVGTATDHGSLSGLSNDDHLQYAMLSGIRAFTGSQEFSAGIDISGGTFALASGTTVNDLSIDGTLGGNSDDTLPTEQAVKTYVDTEIQDLRDELDLINIREVSSDTTAVTGDVVLVDTSTGDVTIDLQEHPDGKVMVKKVSTDVNSVILLVSGGGLIDSLSERSFNTAYEAYTYICDGTNYFVF